MHVVAGSLAAGFLAVFTAGSTSEWQPAIEVPDAAVGDIALNASGDAIAVWTRRSGELVASYRPAGSQRWPSPLSLDTTVDAAAQVAINDRGDAAVVWEHFTRGSDERRLLGLTRSSEGRWSRSTRLSAAASFSNHPDVGIDAAGNVTAISDLQGRIEAVYRPAGGSWQEPRSLASLADFSLTVSGEGHAVIVGRRINSTVAAIRGFGGTWSDLIDLDQVGPRVIPAGAVGPAGDTVVVWSKAVAGNNIVRAAVFEPERGWSQPENLSFADGQATDPDVAVDESGAAVAVWNAAVDVEASYRPPDHEWQPPVAVSPFGTRLLPTVAMSATGRGLVVWKPWSFGEDRPLGAAAIVDGHWGPATEIAPLARGAVNQPGITVDGFGDGIAFWTTSADRSFRTAFYDAGGPLLRAAANSTRPRIFGVPRVGRRLHCSKGTWTGQTPIKYTLVWSRSGRTIGRGKSYAVQRRDVGTRVGCRVTARNAFGASTVASNLVRIGRK